MELEVDLRKLSVRVGLPCGPDIPWQTALSLSRTAAACARRGINFDVIVVYGSSVVTTARSLVVDQFLKTDADRLFWIDSDVVWEPSDFLRVLALSSWHDVVCGTYPLKRDEPGVSSFVIKTESDTERTVNQHGLVKIEGVGLGFTCVSRWPLARLAATKERVLNQPTGDYIANVFRIDVNEGRIRGEDMAFFADLRELGYDIWLDPTLQIGHVGQKEWRGDPVVGLGLQVVYPEAA